jgi:D-serine deaminase-like pyridoxal phosphate-dependent protein
MEFRINGAAEPYIIKRPEEIRTPRLLVFQDRVEFNIKRIQSLMQDVNPELDIKNVWPHVKTTKSAWVVDVLKQSGVSCFKTSLNEVDMLVQSGAEKIFVAYPLLKHDALYIAKTAQAHPDIQFYVQIGHMRHVEILAEILREFSIKWHYFIDANVGMDRTGLPIEEAFELQQLIAAIENFIFCGLHAYDGHVHQKSESERRLTALTSMARLQKSLKHFKDNGVKVPMTIVSGTPGFLLDAEILRDAHIESNVFYSPGTWIYFDSQSREMMPGTFEFAALILAQVIDKPTGNTATLNLGHKRWAIDQGPIEVFSIPGMTAARWSEEHTVVNVPKNVFLEIGDYVLFAPRHVCPTVNLWERFDVVNQLGDVKEMNVSIDARNR